MLSFEAIYTYRYLTFLDNSHMSRVLCMRCALFPWAGITWRHKPLLRGRDPPPLRPQKFIRENIPHNFVSATLFSAWHTVASSVTRDLEYSAREIANIIEDYPRQWSCRERIFRALPASCTNHSIWKFIRVTNHRIQDRFYYSADFFILVHGRLRSKGFESVKI